MGLAAIQPTRAEENRPKPPETTLSPDKRYGITVPASFTMENSWAADNQLIEMKTGQVLGSINSDEPAFARMNHSELLPAWWSADDTSLLWQVAGKWGMETQMLVRLKDSQIQWQLDVIKVLQREILTRTEQADPDRFLAAKKENSGSGSAYPEKFVFDSQPEGWNKGPLKFPVRFHVYLTSNCKGAENVPEVDSSMEATLNEDGRIKVTEFKMGRTKSSPWYKLQTSQW